MFKKIFPALFTLVLLVPAFALADAPPPPPFDVNFTYEGQKITDAKFYAVALQCRQEKISDITVIPQLDINQPDADCSWFPRLSATGGFCSDSTCHFDWVYGKFKLAVYVPNINKVFVSDVINRQYLGHYGRDTQISYDINLLKDSGVEVTDVSPPELFVDDVTGGPLLWLLAGIMVTILLESIVALVFVLLKKAPKKIFFAVLVGNILSVPFVWISGIAAYSVPGILLMTEIIATAFEAWILWLFTKDKLSWKTCLLISLIMNIVSFVVGLCLLILTGNI